MAASSPVWVGGLSLGVNENILLELFSKFGPVKNVVILRDDFGKSKQCGFVNFVSLEAAKTAAVALNGCDILGETIKTRGPAEILGKEKSTSLFSGAANEKRDYRALTDCMFYVSGIDCQPKTGECPYRHNKKSQQTEVVCSLWLQRKCSDVNCPYRHPRLNKPHSNEPVRIQPVRCPSHNAFKCTGECGFASCDTHFMEQESLQEHINKGRERKLLPSAACTQCKAVFFSEEERTHHVCFNNTDVILTTPSEPHRQTQPNLEAQCACNTNTTRVAQSLPRHLSVCSSCGICYENSGDSLSSIDGNGDLQPCSKGGHLCPNSPSVRMGKVNGNENGEREPIGVFWDIENCPVPRGKSALDVVQKIRREFFGGCREVEFMCVCDISKEKREVIEELNKAQVTVVHINATSKNAADDKLRQSLRRFAQSYPAPASVILVSGDINFAAELSDLRHRHNLRVICLHNAQAQNALITCAHEAHRFDHFTANLPIIHTAKVAEDTGLSSELTVLNLPLGKDPAQIKIQLKKLSDNCGGKVVSVAGRCAVIRFPNAFSAARAKKRMDKEDVFGSAIQVVYSTGDIGRTGSPNKMKKRTEESKVVSSNNNVTTFKLLQRDKGNHPQLVDTHGGPFVDTPELKAPLIPDKNSVADDVLRESPNGRLQSTHPEENKDQPGPKQNGKQVLASQQFVNQPGFLNNNAYPNIWPNHFYHSMLNMPSQASGIPGITPLAGPIVGAPPHVAASWLASLHNLSILEQQRGGIDILVTNLDETVNKKELKKKLASVFREHCKVYSVILHSGEGIPLRAFVKVPKLSDAHLAMSKVNQQQIFGTTVTVTIATEKEKELCFLRCEVTSILKETPLHWTPLNRFLSEYYEKCSKSFDTNSLNLIQDLVIVNGTPGNQTISLVTRAVAGAHIKVEPESFAWEVHGLLRTHNEMDIAAFAALYWLKYNKVIEIDSSGIVLEDALNKVPNVIVNMKENEAKFITWIKPGARNGGNLEKALEFGRELKDLLREYPAFKLPLSSLIPEYQKHYGRKEPFDPYVYGFSSVTDLLEALPSVVQISDRCISLTHEMRLQTFEEELKLLLESQPDKCLAFGDFMATYHKCYGRKCRVSSYGFSRLIELIESMPNTAKVHGTGENRFVCLLQKGKTHSIPHEYKTREDNKTALQLLSNELKQILKERADQQVPVSEVMFTYYQHYKQNMKVGELGFRDLAELLQALPGLQFVEKDGISYLSLPPKMTLKSVASDVLLLLKQQEEQFVFVNRLPSLYHKMFNRKFPMAQIKLEELVHTLGNKVQLKGSFHDRILLFNAPENGMSQKRRRLSRKMAIVLMRYPECKVAFSAFNDLFYKQYGHHIKPKEFQCRDLTTLLNEMTDVVEVRVVGYTKMKEVCLKHEFALKVFGSEIIKVLSSQHVLDRPLDIEKFENEYNKLFGRQMMYRNCGFSSLHELLKLMPGVVKVSGSGSSTQVQLSPLQIFALETNKLLSHNDGCVRLSRFAPAYQQHYGRPCKASDYGYSRIVEVLNAIPHVVCTIGKGCKKMVMLTEGELALNVEPTVRISFRPLSRQNSASRTGTPVDGYESDSESIGAEEDVGKNHATPSTTSQADGEIDLISFTNRNGFEAFGSQTSINDWLSIPVPDSLPQPQIKPASTYSTSVGDLISFTEFDTEDFLTGLSDMSQQPRQGQSIRCEPDYYAEKEDIEVATINSMNKDNRSEGLIKTRERSVSDLEQLNTLLKNSLLNRDVSSQSLKDIGNDYLVPQMVESGTCNSSETKDDRVHASVKPRPGTASEERAPRDTASAVKETKEKKSLTTKVRLAANFSLVPKK